MYFSKAPRGETLRKAFGNIGTFLLADNDFSIIVAKSASDQLRQMCLSQSTVSDELAQMQKTLLACMESVCLCFVNSTSLAPN